MNYLVSTFLSLIFSLLFSTEPVKEAENTTEVTKEETPALTVENVQAELERQGVQHSDVVLRQAILETGWFKCEYCSLQGNNLFGFYYKGSYLTFNDWRESVAYYKNWQDQLYKGGDYYEFLTSIGYAEDPKYISLLKQLKGLY